MCFWGAQIFTYILQICEYLKGLNNNDGIYKINFFYVIY